MTEEERMRISSENYADLLLYQGEPAFISSIPGVVIQTMNDVFSIAYIPVIGINNQAISRFGYSTIPKLYGLTSIVSIASSRVNELRNLPNFDLRGNGVLLAFIDTGIDYLNSAFIKSDGMTKIASIWDQTIDSPDGFPQNTEYGTEYSQEQINEALRSIDPRSIVPSVDDNGHGTALAAIAAGTERTENAAVAFSGVAPEAELIIVKLKPAKNYLKEFFAIDQDILCYQENDIMWGIQYCTIKARELGKPIVVCLGVATSQGAHDGRGLLGHFISIIADLPMVAVVVSAGNEGNLGRHYYGVIDPEIGFNTVELNVSENGESFSMELWGGITGIFSIDISSPYGEFISRIAPSIRLNREIHFIFENTVINIDYHLVESDTGDQLILMRFYNATPGIWRFNVYGQGDLPLSFNIWLPMGNFISLQTFFIQPDIYTTVLAPGTVVSSITITAYNPINEALYINASRGYTRGYAIKPEMAAPGVNYIAPGMNNQLQAYTGTGVAASHAAGIVALIMEWGVVRGQYPTLSTIEIKNFLVRGARRKPNLTYPNREWGFGIIDIYRTFLFLREDRT